MVHRYDRRIPNPMPDSRMLFRTTIPVDVVDTRPVCGPVKDQGQEGSCTAHANASDGEWIFRKWPIWIPRISRGSTAPIFSPQYTYAQELIANGDFPQDNGSDGETACQVAITKGFCPLSDYPYVAGQILMPTAAQVAAAAPYKLGAYHGLYNSATALSVLGDPTSWPVLIGFTVYESLESDEVAQTGIYNPQPGESQLGGHEVLMVGFDVGTKPTIRPSGCPPAALIQNSWGTDWAIGGFFWMVLPVLDATDTDLKIVHAGRPWA